MDIHYRRSSIITMLLTILVQIKYSSQGYHEKRLLNGLFGWGSNYSVMERPVVNESMPIPVTFGVSFQQIIDLDEKNQMLTSTVWLTMEWNDYNLRWNSSEYGGLKDIRVNPYKIWRPDILLYNSADQHFDAYHSNVVVYNTGDCTYIPPGIFKSTCKINIAWFPFDEQLCILKFGSWSYDGNKIDLQLKNDAADLQGFLTNGEWELIGIPAKRNVVTYACCPEPYIDITFTVIIRRRVLFYLVNLVIPCCLISSIALLGFCLPVESGEKLTLGVTILLSLTVFLLLVAESMPATSDAMPLIGTYFSLTIVMSSLCVVLTGIVLNVHFRNSQTHIMHPWMRALLLDWLPWILGISRPQAVVPQPRKRRARKHNCERKALDLKTRSHSLLANVLELDDRIIPQHLQVKSAFAKQTLSTNQPNPKCQVQCDGQKEVVRQLHFLTNRMRGEDANTVISSDWKFGARVLDRLFLWIVVGFTLAFTCGVFLRAPHFQI